MSHIYRILFYKWVQIWSSDALDDVYVIKKICFWKNFRCLYLQEFLELSAQISCAKKCRTRETFKKHISRWSLTQLGGYPRDTLLYYEYLEITHLCINPGPVSRILWYIVRYLGDIPPPKLGQTSPGNVFCERFSRPTFFRTRNLCAQLQKLLTIQASKVFSKTCLFGHVNVI